MPEKIPDAPTAELLQLRRAVEASGEVIFMTDREGIFTYVNPAFVALYGFEPDELIGRATPRVLKAGHIGQVKYAEFWRRLLEGESLQDEFVNRTKSGQLVEVEAAVSPVIEDGGRIAGFLAIQRDVTARRQTERQLQRWAEIFENTAVGISVADGTDPASSTPPSRACTASPSTSWSARRSRRSIRPIRRLPSSPRTPASSR